MKSRLVFVFKLKDQEAKQPLTIIILHKQDLALVDEMTPTGL